MRPPAESYRERILVYGGPGTGKSHNALSIADWYQKTNTPGRFYIMDSDNSLGRMLATDFAHLTNVDVEPVYDYAASKSVMEKFTKMMTPDDWVIVDMLGPLWELTQEHFVDRVFTKGMDEFFLDARKANAKGSPLDGYKDWSTINKMYREFPQMLLQARGHVYATAAADAVNAQNDDKDLVSIFGHVGFKPRGQKHMGHTFHSVLLLMRDKQGWRVRTAKDRGRVELQGEVLNDFVTGYLLKAGWKL